MSLKLTGCDQLKPEVAHWGDGLLVALQATPSFGSPRSAPVHKAFPNFGANSFALGGLYDHPAFRLSRSKAWIHEREIDTISLGGFGRGLYQEGL